MQSGWIDAHPMKCPGLKLALMGPGTARSVQWRKSGASGGAGLNNL